MIHVHTAGTRQRAPTRGLGFGTPWTPQFLTFGNGVPAIRVGGGGLVFVGAGRKPVPTLYANVAMIVNGTNPNPDVGAGLRPARRGDAGWHLLGRGMPRPLSRKEPHAEPVVIAPDARFANHGNDSRPHCGHAAACPYTWSGIRVSFDHNHRSRPNNGRDMSLRHRYRAASTPGLRRPLTRRHDAAFLSV